MPGHTLVVYDPDSALVTDILACEDVHESPRSVATTRRGPKKEKPGGYVTAAAVRKQVSTARVLRQRVG